MNVIDLIKEPESTKIDFKKDFPKSIINNASQNQDWEKGKAIIIKDITCIANSLIDSKGYLIYGVTDNITNRNITGINGSYDDADFQQWFSSFIYPLIKFEYSEKVIDNKKIGIFEISPSEKYPHIFIKSINGIFYEGQIWFRQGSSNKIAHYDDIYQMFHGNEPYKIINIDNNPILKQIMDFYKQLGITIVLKNYSNKDTLIKNGYKIAYYPNSRRELWVVTSNGVIDLIAMLKPLNECNGA